MFCVCVCLCVWMTLPAVYFVFILYYGINVRQKANSKQFLIQVQVVQKGRQLATSSHLAQELLMNI